MSTATELFAPTLDVHKALSAELGTAIGTRLGWDRLDGATYVSASRDRGCIVVIGNSGGWWAIRHLPDQPAVTRGPKESAGEAVQCAFKPDVEEST